MNAKRIPYNHDRHFLRVRDMLSETWRASDKPLNWRLDHWNYARYFVMPMIGRRDVRTPTVEDSLEGIRRFDEMTAVWENEQGQVAAALTVEYPWAGSVFFQRRPGYDALLPEMLDHAEANLRDPQTHSLEVYIQDHDVPLLELAAGRGYRKNEKHHQEDVEWVLRDLPGASLPPGFTLHSMAEAGSDLAQRCRIFGLGFNHPEPEDHPTVFAYQELQRAPDYRKELDLYITAPDGEYVACTILWYDEPSRFATFEPVATHPNYRRKGLASDVMLEGMRRVAALGAVKVGVGAWLPVYEALGFEIKGMSHAWEAG
jgi:mycothiol synthase